MSRLDTLLHAVRQHATEHYNEGWDVVVETMIDDEIITAFGRARTETGAIAKIQHDVVDLWVERQAAAGVPEAERELELGREDMVTEPRVYQGLVTEDVDVFGVGVDVDADAAVLHNPLGQHLPGFALEGPVCAACTSELHRPGTRRSQVHHVSVAAVRLCAQRRAEVVEEEQEVNPEYQAELAYERYLENGGRHAEAISADLEEERRREGGTY